VIACVYTDRCIECYCHRHRVRKRDSDLAGLRKVSVLRGTIAVNRKSRQRRADGQRPRCLARSRRLRRDTVAIQPVQWANRAENNPSRLRVYSHVVFSGWGDVSVLCNTRFTLLRQSNVGKGAECDDFDTWIGLNRLNDRVDRVRAF
jgi:hypothetical protein